MSTSWRWFTGGVVLAVVVWWVGSSAVLAGLRALDVPVVLLGLAIAAVTTTASAWRWHLVARELGMAVPMGTAVAACYRAQFLNTMLPGGVLGDVHRGVVHGRAAGATSLGLRTVVWERFAGQVVLACLTAAALVALPFSARPFLPWVVTGGALVAAVVAGCVGRSLVGIVLASVVTATGHVATYVLAARAVGVDAPLVTLVPLALVVLVAAGIPLNLAGWGPREGMAAWAFAAAGLGAATGLATAVAFGAIVLVANLPGALVLVWARGSAPAHAVVRGGEPAHA
jgi:hypothetical protein